MPTLPWTPARGSDLNPEAELIVLGSRLDLRHHRDVVGFLRAALKIRTQVIHSEGAFGVSLIAQPVRKTFWTLSAWSDQAALDAFVGQLPHRDVMVKYRGRLETAEFQTWTVRGDALPKPRSNAKELWHDARARLASVRAPG